MQFYTPHIHEFKNIFAMHTLYSMKHFSVYLFYVILTSMDFIKEIQLFRKILLAAYKQLKMWLNYVEEMSSHPLIVSHGLIIVTHHLDQNHYKFLPSYSQNLREKHWVSIGQELATPLSLRVILISETIWRNAVSTYTLVYYTLIFL